VVRAQPGSRGEPNVTTPFRQKNLWSIDHAYFHREKVGPSHRNAVSAASFSR
jgi:hypothetical protein